MLLANPIFDVYNTRGLRGGIYMKFFVVAMLLSNVSAAHLIECMFI